MNELNFQRQLLCQQDRSTDVVAVVDGDRRTTYGCHIDRVMRLADALRTQVGMTPESSFSVLANNSGAYQELWHAALIGGGIINPLNTRLNPVELAGILEDASPRAIFVDDANLALLDQLPGDSLPRVVRIGGADYESLVSAGRAITPPEPSDDTVAALIYTGGTTGRPKGVMLTQRAVVLNQYHLQMMMHLSNTTVYLCQTPMFHVATMVSITVVPAIGGTVVIPAVFDPARFGALVHRESVTDTALVPTMIAMVLQSESFDAAQLQSLRQIGYGASPMPNRVLADLQRALPRVSLAQGYGMTEASALVTWLSSEDHATGGARLRSVGRPAPGVEVRIRDDVGDTLPTGSVGEVCIRGGNLMAGYWNRPEETADALGRGWYRSGDAGYLDDDGYLFLVDRIKDMIVSGGENVYSVEVEDAIITHPAVQQVAVIGIPHDTWGEAVHAIVVRRPGARATEAELIEHARTTIAGYKVPKSIEFRAEPLPLSGAMKVLKRDLRAPYWKAS